MSDSAPFVRRWILRTFVGLCVYSISSGPVLWLFQSASSFMPSTFLDLAYIFYFPLLILCLLDRSGTLFNVLCRYLDWWKVGFPAVVT